jgi:PAS domain S-box-containing protein
MADDTVRTTADSARDAARVRELEQRVRALELARPNAGPRVGERKIRQLLETTQAIPWEADAHTWTFTYVGPQAVVLFGYPIERWYEDGFWAAHIHVDDREAAIDFCRESSRRCDDYAFEYRMTAADGRIVWIHDIVHVELVDGEAESLRGFMIDITECKRVETALRESQAELQRLTGRLISAHEDERRYLARELHDDLTQRLAALAIEAGKLQDRVQPLHPAIGDSIGELKRRLAAMCADVHGISRRLHPSILDDLGLVDAVRSECASFSEREAVAVRFVPETVPDDVAGDVALCLFRVAQEGLRNVARHALAQQVEIRLASRDGGVMLSVRDDGVGFDLGDTGSGVGLGLGSMAERVRLLDGTLSVRSEPGGGTIVEVRLPLVRNEP